MSGMKQLMVLAISLGVIHVCQLQAQSREFEVASIKRLVPKMLQT